MLRKAFHAQIRKHVKKFLNTAWPPILFERKPCIGLAISGGVDSMALAAVCSDLRTVKSKFDGAFKGFIVDHGVREGSGDEALKVAAELDNLGISAEVLKLDWGEQDPRSLTNFETVARKLRYRALGTACWKSEIHRLLLAHHGDDQAETVLSRMVSGYTGIGLHGMRESAQIPECKGIYGIDSSGSDYSRTLAMNLSQSPIERGGVQIYRPLLPFTKQQLIDFCTYKGVKWFEDATNADKTLTLRNTVRHLTKENQPPKALQRSSVLQMATKLNERYSKLESEARMVMLMHTSIALDLRTGKAVINVNHAWDPYQRLSSVPQQDHYHIRAILLRNILDLVSPLTNIALPDLDPAMDLFFADPEDLNASSSPGPMKVQVAGVSIEREKAPRETTRNVKCSFTRATPTKDQVEDSIPIPFKRESPVTERRFDRELKLIVEGSPQYHSEWMLWDSRYWIRLRIPLTLPHGVSFAIRFLSPDLLSALRKQLQEQHRDNYLALERRLKYAPESLRWTIPAIVAQRNGEERIFSLPTLTWTNQQWLPGSQERMSLHPNFEIRYKNIDLREHPDLSHRIVAFGETGKEKREEDKRRERDMQRLSSSIINEASWGNILGRIDEGPTSKENNKKEGDETDSFSEKVEALELGDFERLFSSSGSNRASDNRQSWESNEDPLNELLKLEHPSEHKA